MLRAFSEGEGDFLKFRNFCLLRSRREIMEIEMMVICFFFLILQRKTLSSNPSFTLKL